MICRIGDRWINGKDGSREGLYPEGLIKKNRGIVNILFTEVYHWFMHIYLWIGIIENVSCFYKHLLLFSIKKHNNHIVAHCKLLFIVYVTLELLEHTLEHSMCSRSYYYFW